MSNAQSVLASLVIFSVTVSAAISEEKAPSSAVNLIAIARAERPEFRPVTAADVSRARLDLQQAAERLEERLGRKAPAWKTYLRWGTLEQQFAEGNEAKANDLRAVLLRCGTNHAGLEWAEFADLRSAIRKYVRVAADIQNARAGEDYERHIASAIDGLSKITKDPYGAAVDQLARDIGWFEEGDQAPKLVRAVRDHYSHPNVILRISGKLIEQMVDSDVDEESPFRDEILGTAITGTSHTKGKVQLTLVPEAERAVFQLNFEGSATSDTTGVNGPAIIESAGVTELRSQKRIALTADGISAEPAKTKASTKTETKNVQASLGGFLALFVTPEAVVNEAWERIRESKGLSERISAEHAEQRFNRKMDDKIDVPLKEANGEYLEHVRHPLLRKDLFPRLVQLRSTDGAFGLSALVHSNVQLGANHKPPTVSDTSDVVFAVHQSLINNVCDVFLSGKTIDRDRFGEVWSSIIGADAPMDHSLSGGTKVEVVLDDSKPLRIAIDGGVVSVTMRGRVSTSASDGPTPEYVVQYKLKKSDDDKLFIKRLADTATSHSDEALSATNLHDDARRELREALRDVFAKESVGDHIQFPGLLDKLGKFELDHLYVDEGWLLISGRRNARL